MFDVIAEDNEHQREVTEFPSPCWIEFLVYSGGEGRNNEICYLAVILLPCSFQNTQLPLAQSCTNNLIIFPLYKHFYAAWFRHDTFVILSSFSTSPMVTGWRKAPWTPARALLHFFHSQFMQQKKKQLKAVCERNICHKI